MLSVKQWKDRFRRSAVSKETYNADGYHALCIAVVKKQYKIIDLH